jgi:hypothetical protein
VRTFMHKARLTPIEDHAMPMPEPVKLVVRAVELRVRQVHLRLPFRFGANTLTSCPQLFARVTVELDGARKAQGFAAELMVPKWFDKRVAFTAEDNISHLALATRAAANAYLNDAPATSFGLFARHYPQLLRLGQGQGLTELSTAFGQAVIDRAVIDAICHAQNASFFDAARLNLLGLCDSSVVPDMAGWDWSAWLATLCPLHSVHARHTVGLIDDLDAMKFGADGLPISLRAVIDRYGHQYFKIKLGGDPASDMKRLHAVLSVLDDAVGEYCYTVDGNEQYSSMSSLNELLAGLRTIKAPIYIEQPVPREMTAWADLPANPVAPLLIDEADGTLDSFLQARGKGWTGVSSKACKGVYKSLINRARCQRWNAHAGQDKYFMSAEDLTCQAGLAVQQDLALVALLGITHSERNGHHFGNGFGLAPAGEQHAFASAHPDLYELHGDVARLRIHQGSIALDTLFSPGYAHSAEPDWLATEPLPH